LQPTFDRNPQHRLIRSPVPSRLHDQLERGQPQLRRRVRRAHRVQPGLVADIELLHHQHRGRLRVGQCGKQALLQRMVRGIVVGFAQQHDIGGACLS
jgi:hypothetical protein